MWIDIECPKCNYRDEIQLIDAQTEKVIFCHNCKTTIQIHDDNASVHQSVEKIKSFSKEIDQFFKNFGK